MAASTSGALKAYIEAAGLSLAGYRDEAPDGASLPYTTILEAIALVPDPADNAYNGEAHAGRETVQVSLWQQWRNPSTKAITESYSLPGALVRALNGAVLATSGSGAPPTHVWGLRVVSMVRIPEHDNNRIQHAITLEVLRDL